MMVWISVVLGLVLGLLLLIGYWHIYRRRQYYSGLQKWREQVCRENAISLKSRTDNPILGEKFAKHLIIRVDDFLDEESLQRLRKEGLGNLSNGIRSFIPTHKKGRSLPYEKLHQNAPSCLAFYHSRAFQNWLSGIVGEKISPALDHDQSACSILYYDQSGDHINWHFDHNYYKGRQFTVLLSLVNKADSGGLSASKLQKKHKNGQVEEVDTAENSLVIFEGAKVLHRVSPTSEGDLRVILSMTYNTLPRINPFWEIVRRCKDTAFHGLKVLWN